MPPPDMGAVEPERRRSTFARPEREVRIVSTARVLGANFVDHERSLRHVSTRVSNFYHMRSIVRARVVSATALRTWRTHQGEIEGRYSTSQSWCAAGRHAITSRAQGALLALLAG